MWVQIATDRGNFPRCSSDEDEWVNTGELASFPRAPITVCSSFHHHYPEMEKEMAAGHHTTAQHKHEAFDIYPEKRHVGWLDLVCLLVRPLIGFKQSHGTWGNQGNHSTMVAEVNLTALVRYLRIDRSRHLVALHTIFLPTVFSFISQSTFFVSFSFR